MTNKMDYKFKKSKVLKITESNTAVKGYTKQYTVDGIDGMDLKTFLDHVQPDVVDLLSENRQTKVHLVATCKMERQEEQKVKPAIPSFRSKTVVNLDGTNVIELYTNAKDKILESMANFQMQGSNWRFREVLKLEINTAIYKPLKGESYMPLPDVLAKKRAIVNMHNEKDDECFKWCVTRALNPVKTNQDRVTPMLREQSEAFNWKGIEFPVSLQDIVKFEKNNPEISVFVFGYENSVYPLRKPEHQASTVVDLLLISNGSTSHYCLIKSLSRLLSSQESKTKETRYYCRMCLKGFCSEESLKNHQEYCKEHEAVRVVLPEPGKNILKFKNYNNSMRVPFIIYADFESFIKPINTCQPNPIKSYHNKYQKHIPSSFCYYINCFDDSVYSSYPVTFTAKNEYDDVAQKFIDSIIKEVTEIYEQFKFAKKMTFNEDDEKIFEETKLCHICEKEFKDKPTDHCHVIKKINGKNNCIICKQDLDDETKVRDHCHLSGKFRGAAHYGCNINYKIPKFFPVVFHNLSGYDSHLFIKKIGCGKPASERSNIKCIPNNEEKYISFSREVEVGKFTKDGKEIIVKRELRFIDSFKFMACSLDTLAKNLAPEQCKTLNKYFSGEKRDLLLTKGIYPYEYMDSVDRLAETELPPKSAFYSKLNDCGINEDEYEHAKKVWNEFKCETLGDYHNVYNLSDVLLLCDVFENFRDICMNNYKLDPAWYYTSPGLAWDAALKLTKVELELLTDYDMILLIRRGIRGGVSTISHRYAKANNKYMGEIFDSNNVSSFIMYLDSNNLYGWAMSKPLPTRGFKWMDENELNNWKNITDQDGVGWILEVDLEYPKELHDLHNDYPLAPESVKNGDSKVSKLVPNLNNKRKYAVHYENLKLYESLGLKITNIHRGIRFEESTWLKEYIDLNTNLRTKATDDFEKDFFKQMNNSVFGKTMENIENRVDVRLVANRELAIELAAKPNYDSTTIFDENLVAIHMKRTKLLYNKPIYLGMCILDLSKTLMYDFHYNYIKKKYGDKAKLLFTDTDSLAYEIKTDDFYADISNDVESRFDTSEYPKDHPSRIKTGVNKKVIGMFKDEVCGKQIEEFVGLRSKLYSYKMWGCDGCKNDEIGPRHCVCSYVGDEHKKCKGIKKSTVKNTITHDDYRNCLETRNEQMRKMNVIRSHLHDIYSEEINKVALSADDDKRIILEDGVHTLAYGHYSQEKN